MAKFIQTPETFFVEEIPLAECCGFGNHLWVTFSRKSMSTFFIASKLKNILKIKETEIGIAGNKDKLATAIQTISLPSRLEPKIFNAFKSIGAEILSAKLHNEKLRMGQIAGNKFKILIDIFSREDYENISEKIDDAQKKGFPNFFGPQRVSDEHSIEEGKKIFLNKSSKNGNRKNRFLVSVFQSAVFNSYLKNRIKKQLYPNPIIGDIVKIGEKLVVLSDGLKNRGEWENEAILTGPIIGSKMILPLGDPLTLEKEAVEKYGIQFDEIFLSRARGSRRECCSKPKEIAIKIISEKKVELSFTLQKGSYATTLLKFIGVETAIDKSGKED